MSDSNLNSNQGIKNTNTILDTYNLKISTKSQSPTIKQTPQTLKGFRDFLPAEKRARDYVAKKIIETFELFGFEPIETPTLEYASLLTGKYGDEADKLVYTFEDKGERKVGLRYDQTVPTARVLSQYQNELPKYFRRYQIQNVFRADKPQHGRYREFTQCDADIYNAHEPIADAEILSVFYSIYSSLGISDIKILVNDRRSLLFTIEPFANDKISVTSIIQCLDKLDKMTEEEVESELVKKGLDVMGASSVIKIVKQTKISEQLASICESAIKLGVPSQNLHFTPTLARGLDYYTGLIFEAVVPIPGFGSVGAGGRYDNLIEDLGGPLTPAVGFGIGFDRTVEAAQTLNLIPSSKSGTQLLITVFDSSTLPYSLQLANQSRLAGINTEVYPSADKLPKQFKYANKKQIPVVVIAGPDEASKKMATIKNMLTGEQQTIPSNQMTNIIRANSLT